MIVLLPVFLLTSCIIKISEPRGTVFFAQKRIGKNEKPFTMYKFRTMKMNAENDLQSLLDQNEMDGAMFKIKKDPRVTKFGSFLRKTSIDELPQLINVLKGEMTLVGPRPPLPREVATYTSYEKLRLNAIPGCTGLWQVSGRNDLSFEEMVDLDLTYINQSCLLLDFKIMLKTVLILLVSRNGY